MPFAAQLQFLRKRLSWPPDLESCLHGSRRLLTPAKPALTAAILVLGGLCSNDLRGQATKEYDLKAVLLYNFTQFIEWPQTSFSGPTAPIVIGVLGHDPFGKVLDDLVRQETRDHRRIIVERYRTINAIGNCQILFIDDGEERFLPKILSTIRGRPILTVGDFSDFTQHGGMVQFLRGADDKITLRINLEAAKTGGLTISARLLRVAEIVSDRPLTP